MATVKHFYAYKLLSDYRDGELSVYYDINPHSERPVRIKDGLDYVGVEFSEKLDGSIDNRNKTRLQELIDNRWILFEDANKAGAFINQDVDKPTEYVPTDEELGKE